MQSLKWTVGNAIPFRDAWGSTIHVLTKGEGGITDRSWDWWSLGHGGVIVDNTKYTINEVKSRKLK